MDSTTRKPRRPGRLSRAPSRRPRPLEERPLIPTVLVFEHTPKPGRRLSPVRTFRVVGEMARLDAIHEGRGLTAEDVVVRVAKDWARVDDGEPGPPADLTVYSGELVAAVVRMLGDGQGGYRVFRPAETPAAPTPAPAPAPPPRRLGGPAYDRTHLEARPLSLSVCRAAVAEWESARGRRADGYRRYGASEARKDPGSPKEAREWERWLDALTSIECEAERRVAALVLMVHGRVAHPDDVAGLAPGWAPVALDLDGGPIYVAAPEADDDPRPRLTVVDVGDFDSQDFGAVCRGDGPDV